MAPSAVRALARVVGVLCAVVVIMGADVRRFIIHGLWPDYDGGKDKFPVCCESRYYSEEAVKLVCASHEELQQQLAVAWPALKQCNFLQYEYDKHGTCASTVYDGENGPLDYWTAAVNLWNKHNFLETLSRAGIKHSTPDEVFYYHPLLDILSILQKDTGTKIGITCDGNMLKEIKLCVGRPSPSNKHYLSPIDCPNALLREENSCTKYNKIIIPQFTNITNTMGCSARLLVLIGLSAAKWENCGTATDVIHINSLNVAPSPIEFGENITVSFNIDVSVNITAMTLDLTIEKNVHHKWRVYVEHEHSGAILTHFRIPCIAGVGSCKYEDVCQILNSTDITCPDELVVHDIPCKCPFYAGNYVLPETSFGPVPLPPPVLDWLTEGTYRATTKLSDPATKKPIGCYVFEFELDK
ncbi:ganglioside gm2 activator [Pelomyxa schiedti]|nr:ganglioside gm2 activator [Pelomyxa schiedti]